MRKIIYILSMGLLVLTSCIERELELTDRSRIGEPVVNAIINEESPVSVYISRSIAPLDSSFGSVTNNMLISLMENGKFKEVLSFNQATNAYVGSSIPQPGNIYALEVKEGVNQPVRITANTLLPLKPKVLQMSFKDSNMTINGEIYGTLSYDMEDPDCEQIYRLVIYYYNTSMARFIPLSYLTNDAVLRDTLLTIENERFFDDHAFNNKPHHFEVYVKSGSYYAFNNKNYLIVEHFSLSPEYFKYYKSLNDYMNAGSAKNGLNNQVTLYSNTNTGIGIFAGFTSKRDTIN